MVIVVGRGGIILISDEIPPTAMQATMGHLERKSNPKGGTVGDEISSSQNFDRLRMTRRGKADSFAAPYARHQILQNKKDMYISEDTHLLILSLITPVLGEDSEACEAVVNDDTVRRQSRRG